ncbi:MAG: hypothetical protein ACREIQ_03630 [Nitrospiria bacterium]
MDPRTEKEVEELAKVVTEIGEEIDLAADEDATSEEIEKAKGLAADFLSKYDGLLKRLGSDEKMEVQRTIGLKVERMKGKLTQLREAPE